MEEKKYILISMEDERSTHLADVLGNKTCKKIIEILAEKEMSEKDISDNLKLPLNTTEYNLKKLIKAELIEKTSNFFWSQKGKKIPTYKLSNKSIIISPKSSRINSKIKSILPVALLSGLGAFLIKSFFYSQKIIQERADEVLASEFASKTSQSAILDGNILSFQSPAWIWFLAGTLFAIAIFTLINWRKL